MTIPQSLPFRPRINEARVVSPRGLVGAIAVRNWSFDLGRREVIQNDRLFSNYRARTTASCTKPLCAAESGGVGFALTNEFDVCSGNSAHVQIARLRPKSLRTVRTSSVWWLLQNAGVVAIVYEREEKLKWCDFFSGPSLTSCR